MKPKMGFTDDSTAFLDDIIVYLKELKTVDLFQILQRILEYYK
jgi:hypothetical protein